MYIPSRQTCTVVNHISGSVMTSHYCPDSSYITSLNMCMYTNVHAHVHVIRIQAKMYVLVVGLTLVINANSLYALPTELTQGGTASNGCLKTL